MPRRAPQRVRPSLSTSLRLPAPSSGLNTDWMNSIKRICIREVCKKEFDVTAPNQHACPECQPLHHQKRRHGYYVDVELPNIDRVNELHAIARAKRCPPKELPCRICGKKFTRKRSEVTCDDPECRKQNKITMRAEYDIREYDAVNEKRREKWAANSDEINAARRAERAQKKRTTKG
jgi:hypothetical protein